MSLVKLVADEKYPSILARFPGDALYETMSADVEVDLPEDEAADLRRVLGEFDAWHDRLLALVRRSSSHRSRQVTVRTTVVPGNGTLQVASSSRSEVPLWATLNGTAITVEKAEEMITGMPADPPGKAGG